MTTGNDIFGITGIEQTDNRITINVDINQHSEIFKGHFPGQPVVPGACMLQLVKDGLETALEKSVMLKKADQVKFISMLTPGDEQEISLTIDHKPIDENTIMVTAGLTSNGATCFKLRGSFIL